MNSLHYDVFISVRSKDYAAAQPLYDFLTKEKNLSVFKADISLSNDAHSNVRWRGEIEKALMAADNFILYALDIDDYNRNEIDFEIGIFKGQFIAKKKKNLIQIVPIGTDKEQIPDPYLRELNFFYSDIDYDIIYQYCKPPAPNLLPVTTTGISQIEDIKPDYYSLFHEETLKYHIKKNHNLPVNDVDLMVKYFSELFGTSINAVLDNGDVDVYGEGQLIKHIADRINADDFHCPIIRGAAGSGKSTLMSVLYRYLYRLFIDEVINDKVPVFISLHHYNKMNCVNIANYEEEITNAIRNDLAKLSKIAEQHEGKKLIILLDGIGDPAVQKIDYYAEFLDVLSYLPIHKVVCGVRRDDFSDKFLSDLLDDKNKVFYDFERLNVYDKRYTLYVERFSQIASLKPQARSKESIEKYLTTLLKKYGISNIDFFTLLMLLESIYQIVMFDNPTHFSKYVEKYLVLKKININKAVGIASKTFKNQELAASEINTNEWWFVHKHHSFKEYLVARFIADKLIVPAAKLSIDSFVYPFDLNAFCKDIINSNPNNQRIASDNIKKLIVDDISGSTDIINTNLMAKVHLCYLLGRFTDPPIINKAHELLNIIKEKLLKKFDYNKMDYTNPTVKQQLLLMRTVYISLTYSGNRNAGQEYIRHLLNNKPSDNLNRGFHLEYYGDMPYHFDDADTLKHDDNLMDYTKTFQHLYNRVKDYSKIETYSMYEIELYTLISLAQHRQLNPDIVTNEKEYRMAIYDLLNKLPQDKLCDDLKRYIRFIKPILKSDKPVHAAGFILELYKIKEHYRVGWVKANLNRKETVASHIYMATMLAIKFLPEYLPDYPEYDKFTIVQMLLFHDLPEAYDGDFDASQKDNERRRIEKEYMSNISFWGLYEGIAGLRYTYDLYNNFHSPKDINGKIARDIDKIDAFMQLHIFKNNLFDVNNLEPGDINFEELKEIETWYSHDLETDEGSRIRRLLFAPIIEKLNSFGIEQ